MPNDLNLPALALPAYARVDLAFTDVFFITNATFQAGATRMMFFVPGEFIYYVISAYADITTDATVGNRALVWLVLDPDGNVVTQSPAAAVQPAAVRYTYQWALNPGAAYGPLNGQLLSPIPPQVLTAGYRSGFQFNGKVPGDIGVSSFVVIKIPTGPPLGSPAAALGEPLRL